MAHITLKELAAELGMDRSNMRKYALKHGLVPFRVRTTDSRSQLTLAVNPEDAEQLRARRAKEGYAPSTKDDTVVPNGWGYFYVVQLIPEFAPQRIKMGFTTDLDGRMLAHRTAAPTARLLQTWPCRKVWECAAIDSITRIGCIPLSNEVFDADEPDALVARAEQFFGLMPLDRTEESPDVD